LLLQRIVSSGVAGRREFLRRDACEYGSRNHQEWFVSPELGEGRKKPAERLMTETTTPTDLASIVTVAIADGGTATEEIQSDPCFTIEIKRNDTVRRRYRFEPRQENPGWWRYDEEWTGTSWELHDRECVCSVSLTVDGGSII